MLFLFRIEKYYGDEHRYEEHLHLLAAASISVCCDVRPSVTTSVTKELKYVSKLVSK